MRIRKYVIKLCYNTMLHETVKINLPHVSKKKVETYIFREAIRINSWAIHH